MHRKRRVVAALLLAALLFSQGTLLAQDNSSLSGFVVIDGQYLAPPYQVFGQGPAASINGRSLVVRAWRDDDNDDEDPEFFSDVSWQGVESSASRIRATLKVGGLVIVTADRQGACVMPPISHALLETALSSGDPQEKSQRLEGQGLHWMERATLLQLVENLSGSAPLQERMAPIIEASRKRYESDLARHRTFIAAAGFLRTDLARYGVTVLAMGLTVAGFGQLLNHPPKRRARWTDIDRRGDRVSMVARNVTLLAALSVFDLACTLAAQQAGGFLELNPLNQGVTSAVPLRMIVFKLAGVGLTCGILLLLRRYRGAQQASWWLCLVLVLLAFRWITYNSMFMV